MSNLLPFSYSRQALPRQAYPLAALTLLLAAGAVQGQTPASFASASTYPASVGGDPQGVTVADVNGDGRPDLVTANFTSNSVSVLLGQTGGGFAAAITYPTGAISAPTAVVVADVNRDGRPDIVTANYGNSAGVLLGQAGGGFATFSTYPTGFNSYPRGVAVADVNGDGRPDLVTANYSFNGTVGVLLGQTGGSFTAISTYSVGTNSFPSDVAVADINGDGRPDIIATNSGNDTAGVLLGQAGGGFAAVSTYSTGTGSAPTAVAVADVNGDGRLDLVEANSDNNTVGVLLGQANGNFAAVSTYPTSTGSRPRRVVVADVNGDGRLDIITANPGNNTAGVLLGQTSGSFAAVSTYPTGFYSSPQGLAVADVNSDGRPDIVTSNAPGTAGVLLNTGTFTPLATTAGLAAAEVTLFPNPTRGSFAVQLPADCGAGLVRAELLNALGQVVAARTAARPADGTTLPFATDGLAAGVYVLRVQAGDHMLKKRVVLE